MSSRSPLDMGGAFAGVPLCNVKCEQHDGKRCKLTGNEPGEVCVPEVRQLAVRAAVPAVHPSHLSTIIDVLETERDDARAECDKLRALLGEALGLVTGAIDVGACWYTKDDLAQTRALDDERVRIAKAGGVE